MTEAPDLVWKGDLLAGELAIVTGSARGIGLATARQLGNLGAKVALFDLNEEGVKASAQELAEAGIETTARAGDVSNPTMSRRSPSTPRRGRPSPSASSCRTQASCATDRSRT